MYFTGTCTCVWERERNLYACTTALEKCQLKIMYMHIILVKKVYYVYMYMWVKVAYC